MNPTTIALSARLPRRTCRLAIAALVGVLSGCATDPPAADPPVVEPVTATDPVVAESAPLSASADGVTDEPLTVAMSSPVDSAAPIPAQPIDRPGEDVRIGQSLARLTDPGAPAADRRGAALVLLQIGGPAANDALQHAVSEATIDGAARAVVQAILLSAATPPAALGDLLLDRLPLVDPPLQQEIGEALGRIGDPDVTQRLIHYARDGGLDMERRLVAIRALGYQRSKEAVDTLMALIAEERPLAVQDAAFESLATLTGLETLEHDRSAWQAWWRQARRYDPERWAAMLMENLARRDAARRMRQAEVERRLIESQRALYRTTSPEERPTVLAGMLNDSLTSVRLLGMELALERQLGGLPFDGALRGALRARLTDPSSALRQQAALRLADLGDEPAAAVVADRLASNAEHASNVIRAYLVLMTRLPHAEAVEPALAMLGREGVQNEAAAALAAMAQAGMLGPNETRRAAATVRRVIRETDTPTPALVSLLGRVGGDEDWDHIADWVDDEDSAIRQAAAMAWAQSNRSLKLLADRVDDPVIQLIVIDAAARRGNDPFTLQALAANPPQRPQVLDAWRRALVAMAGRVPVEGLMDAIATLRERPGNHSSGLVEQMLASALNRTDGRTLTDAQRVALRLARAESLLQHGGHLAALEDLRAAAGRRPAMPSAQKARFDRLTIDANLAAENFDDAVAAAVSAVRSSTDGPAESTTAADVSSVNRILDFAATQVERGRREAAVLLLDKLRTAFGADLPPAVRGRIAALRERARSETTSQAPAQPATVPE